MSYQVLQSCCAVLILSVVLGLCPAAALAEETACAPGISNFQKVSPTLWRGAAPSAKGLTDLARSGAKTVIDLRKPGSGATRESRDAAKLGLNYFQIPIGYCAPSVEKINQFLKIVTDHQYQPVFIHCRQGCDRTGTVVGIYRMLVEGWSFKQAYGEMREHHFKPWMLSLKRAVADWEPSAPVAQSKVAEKQERSL